jgi:hypothetical protein
MIHLLTGDIRDFVPFMNDPGRTEGIVIRSVAELLREIDSGKGCGREDDSG